MTPDVAASRTFSVSSCRISRSRSTPTASRIPISRQRLADRASTGFATFTQTIRSSSPEIPPAEHLPTLGSGSAARRGSSRFVVIGFRRPLLLPVVAEAARGAGRLTPNTTYGQAPGRNSPDLSSCSASHYIEPRGSRHGRPTDRTTATETEPGLTGQGRRDAAEAFGNRCEWPYSSSLPARSRRTVVGPGPSRN